jgi:hypothetical protein
MNLNLGLTKKRPLVCYSDNCNQRAVLVSSATGKPMPAAAGARKRRRRGTSIRRRKGTRIGRKRATKLGRRRRRRTAGGRSKVRIVKGRISLRVAGFPGYQKIGASQLVRFVPLAKLRVAAKRALGGLGYRRKRSGKGVKRRRRQRKGTSSLFRV